MLDISFRRLGRIPARYSQPTTRVAGLDGGLVVFCLWQELVYPLDVGAIRPDARECALSRDEVGETGSRDCDDACAGDPGGGIEVYAVSYRDKVCDTSCQYEEHKDLMTSAIEHTLSVCEFTVRAHDTIGIRLLSPLVQ